MGLSLHSLPSRAVALTPSYDKFPRFLARNLATGFGNNTNGKKGDMPLSEGGDPLARDFGELEMAELAGGSRWPAPVRSILASQEAGVVSQTLSIAP